MTVLTMFLCFALFILGILSYYGLYLLFYWIGDLRYKRYIKKNPRKDRNTLVCTMLTNSIGLCEPIEKKGGKKWVH